MFKRKAAETPSPETSLSHLYADVLNEHRYERLEWAVSWTTLPIFRMFAGFYSSSFLTQWDTTPPLFEGIFCDIAVYLDKELPDGVVEIRSVVGDVLATANFSAEGA